MVTYKNSYQPPKAPTIPSDIHLDTPPQDYDFNYYFEVKQLASDRLELRPFIPSLHAAMFLDGVQNCAPGLTHWIPQDFHTLEDVLVWVEKTTRSQPSAMTYAIFTAPRNSTGPVDPKDYVMAGVASLINSDVDGMTAELGWIMIFDQFQRTHVLTHTAGLLMHRILDMPAEGGLGLRRCQWFATSLNERSKAAALRLGFKVDGVLRAHRVLPKGKEGIRPGRPGDYREECQTRDSWLAAVSWDQWEAEGGVREHVDKLMARQK
ncbi:hypothetical protein IAT38_007627 [Cryptococcus sp. DSM 104549]